jgi:hypothetical protein
MRTSQLPISNLETQKKNLKNKKGKKRKIQGRAS